MKQPATSHVLGLVLRLATALAALWLGWRIEPWLSAIPGAVLGGKNVPDQRAVILGIVAWFVGIHLIIFVLSAVLRRSASFSLTSYLAQSLYLSVAGTALTTLAIFFTSQATAPRECR